MYSVSRVLLFRARAAPLCWLPACASRVLRPDATSPQERASGRMSDPFSVRVLAPCAVFLYVDRCRMYVVQHIAHDGRPPPRAGRESFKERTRVHCAGEPSTGKTMKRDVVRCGSVFVFTVHTLLFHATVMKM